MIKSMKVAITLLALTTILSSCERVAPNFYGVLMEDYGKNGKSDYSLQQGRVNVAGLGTELFQVPAFEQRANFGEQILHLKASDNTEFSAKPLYSFKVIKEKVVDLVFENSRLGSGGDFMLQLEDNILEPHIYDLIKEESRKYLTDTLMSVGGNLRFEMKIQELVRKAFADKGLELITFSSNLDFSRKVKDKIDARNEINTNVSVIDQQIIEYRKKITLAKLISDYNLEISRGITDELLRQEFIKKWDGHSTLYGTGMPVQLFKNVK